jgi:hypothetical protein
MLHSFKETSYFNNARQGGNTAGAWNYHSSLYSVEYKNVWSCTSTPRISARRGA